MEQTTLGDIYKELQDAILRVKLSDKIAEAKLLLEQEHSELNAEDIKALKEIIALAEEKYNSLLLSKHAIIIRKEN